MPNGTETVCLSGRPEVVGRLPNGAFDPKPTSINLNLLKDGLRSVSGRLLPTLSRYMVDAIARTVGDFGTEQRCGCLRGKQAVSSTTNLGADKGGLPVTVQRGYRKPFSRRKAVGVTPTSLRNTRFSWAAPLNPARERHVGN